MTRKEKIAAVRKAAPRHHISGDSLPHGYWYGENPYTDMLIENALYCDMFREDVPNIRDYHGFDRTAYYLSHAK